MRLFFAFVFVCPMPMLSIGQALPIEWQHCYGGSNTDRAQTIIRTFDSGYAIAATTRSGDGDITTLPGSTDNWIIKLNQVGSITWQTLLGGSNVENVGSILQTADSGYIVAGGTSSNDGDVTHYHGGYGDAWVVKLNKNGSLLWEKALGGGGPDNFNSIIPTTDGGYIAVGCSSSTDGDVTGYHGPGLLDAWVVKLNDTGGITWQHCFGGTANDNAYDVIQTGDSGFIVAGYTGSVDGDVSGHHGALYSPDAWILKLSPTGSMIWEKCLGGSGADVIYSVIKKAPAQYILAGSTSSADGDVTTFHGGDIYGGDVWVISINDTGHIIWQKTYGGSKNEVANDIKNTSGNGYVLAGWTESSDGDITFKHDTTDYWILKLDDTGAIQWQTCLGGSGIDRACSILQENSNEYVITGSVSSNDGNTTANHGNDDVWTVKIGYGTNIAETIKRPQVTLFPNPNSGEFSVEVPYNKPGYILQVFDMTGKKILENVGNMSRFTFAVQGVPGVYTVRIITTETTTELPLIIQ